MANRRLRLACSDRPGAIQAINFPEVAQWARGARLPCL